ncbi:glycoside hydrolase family 5 C-terminal domain-containing protein [Microdochium nivale]|nr:glycoside hydrolase family 5 C-terminal domain-containing protein [Microdochium nivale]
MLEAHAAHDLSDAALGGVPLRIRGSRFVDGYGRVVIPRGLNVSGCSKLPTTPDGRSHLTEGFYDRHRTVSFVGRPFPLADAPVHFARLRSWGMTFVRLLVTWESLGHAGPNPATDLDGEYIAYLRSLVDMMPRFGLKCFVCAHQDVWSRFSGGSGAPAWTFEAAGLDVEAFTDTGAAYIHGQDEARRRARSPLPPGVQDREPSGPFVWPSGYQKLAASTMATLFWAGEALAPKLRCRRSRLRSGGAGKEGDAEEEVSIQTFLQDALIEAFGALADAVGPLEACIGFEAMNEPHRGMVNLHSVDNWNYDTDLHIGHYPSLPQALALGSGHAQEVPFYVKTWPYPTKVSHYSLVDPKGRSAWLAAGDQGEQKVDRPRGLGQCVWRAHGVWEWDEKTQKAVVLDKKYFEHDHRAGGGGGSRKDGKKLEWYRDCYAPFVARFHERMGRYSTSASSTASPTNMAFVAPIPNEFIPPWQPLKHETAARRQTYAVKTIIDTPRPRNMVYAPHFYDLNVLFNKAYGSIMSVDVQGLSRGMFPLRALHFLSAGLRRNYARQIRNIVRHGPLSLGADSAPTIIGEIGIPFDVNARAAYRSGNFDVHRDLYNALIAAMEDCLVGFTLWNYNPGNTVEHGDGWNKEDFSMITSDRPPNHAPDYRNARHEADPTYTGGRALDVIIRPYAAKIAGEPLRTSWDERTLRFELEWEEARQSSTSSPRGLLDALEDKAHQTEVFMPAYHYAGKKLAVSVSGGADWSYNAAQQTLYVRHAAAAGAGAAQGIKIAARRHRLVVEIRDVHAHLLDRVVERRRLLPRSELGLWGLVLGVAPPEVEVWVENLLAGRDETLLGVLVGLLALLLALAMARVM